jgi:GH15 family glucan-1,4-alpha-glucosidase
MTWASDGPAGVSEWAATDIGDYALIGDCETAALVSSRGSIDWLCWPRFDSDACLAALLGGPDCGSWTISPRNLLLRSKRQYLPDTLIVETKMFAKEGELRLIDFMPFRALTSDIVRIVVGERGTVPMRMKLGLRFDYGRARPWLVRLDERSVKATAGPHAVVIETAAEPTIENGEVAVDFTIDSGRRMGFVARYRPSYCSRQPPLDTERALKSTEQAWRDWSASCSYRGPWREAVVRSLITMKALTYRPTGATVAAPTTSLTESPDIPKNWDYRFCWLRDAAFAMPAFIRGGYREEATAWRDWLLRATAGNPDQVQPVYGIAGEPRIPEWRVPWLPGRSARYMVHIGNAAFGQLQIDVYGEVLDALNSARKHGLDEPAAGYQIEARLTEHVEKIWNQPDHGIWESRHALEHYTHSKVMAWVAVDRAVRAAEAHRLPWPLERWRQLRAMIHADVCANGFDHDLGAFVRSYRSRTPDASTLLIPLVGFLPPDDPRVIGTLHAIEKNLATEGFVRRYDHSKTRGEGREGAFLACSFWLIDNLLLRGDRDRAHELFEQVLAARNDVGLLSEEYEPPSGRFRGNFPQALSHLSLVNTAFALTENPP